MRALVTLLALLVGGALGVVGPVLIGIALNVGSMSYEAFIPIALVTLPLGAIGVAVLANLAFSRIERGRAK